MKTTAKNLVFQKAAKKVRAEGDRGNESDKRQGKNSRGTAAPAGGRGQGRATEGVNRPETGEIDREETFANETKTTKTRLNGTRTRVERGWG
jgi:hypothetical protein